MRVAPGSALVTPSKDGKVKGLDGKKVTLDGKTAKVEGGGKEPVIVEPGNRLVKSKLVILSHYMLQSVEVENLYKLVNSMVRQKSLQASAGVCRCPLVSILLKEGTCLSLFHTFAHFAIPGSVVCVNDCLSCYARNSLQFSFAVRVTAQ